MHGPRFNRGLVNRSVDGIERIAQASIDALHGSIAVLRSMRNASIRSMSIRCTNQPKQQQFQQLVLKRTRRRGNFRRERASPKQQLLPQVANQNPL